ncbi:MAG: asparaginase [Cyclobacteriaceae bacterium]|nr:asparaginase [Cyclobacteriaceae bacterium]
MKLHELRIDTASPEQPQASIMIIYTGGTAGMVLDKSKALVPFDFNLILEHMPVLKSFNLLLKVVSFDTPVDSSNINPEHWKLIAEIILHNYQTHDGFVVLHGTDTMAYTASALSFMLEGLNKPVIFTGAQLPVSSPRSDAHENLVTSLEIASAQKDGRPIVPEVAIYFDYYLFRANRAKKVESQHFDAFNSENYPTLAEAGIAIEYNTDRILPFVPGDHLKVSTSIDTAVTILKLFPGMSKTTVESVLSTPGLKGVVMETFGAGNAPTTPWLVDCLSRAIDAGIIIFNVSQCPGGKVSQGRYETSKILDMIGVIGGNDITLEAAITKMMYLLGTIKSKKEVKKLLSLPLRGEMDDRK